MIQNRVNLFNGPSHLSAEASHRILGKLRDLNLSGERIFLAGGLRVDFHGCLGPEAPIYDQLHYQLVLDGADARLFSITLERGRLCLALCSRKDMDPEHSRWLNLVENEHGHACTPQIGATLDPATTNASEVEAFLFDLTTACLPAF